MGIRSSLMHNPILKGSICPVSSRSLRCSPMAISAAGVRVDAKYPSSVMNHWGGVCGSMSRAKISAQKQER